MNISNFEQLQNFIIAEQIKKRTPPEVKEHFVDSLSEVNNPLELAEKLEYYENVRLGMKKNAPPNAKKPYCKENIKFVPEEKFKTNDPKIVNQIKSTNFGNSKFTNSR